MTGDSLTPEQPPSGPLYAPQGDETPSAGASRRPGGGSGPQAGAGGFGSVLSAARAHVAHEHDTAVRNAAAPHKTPEAEHVQTGIAAGLEIALGIIDHHTPAIRDTQAELAALKAVARGYCPACGRGDAAPTVDDWQRERRRAEEAEATVERVRHALMNQSYLTSLDETIAAALDPQEQPPTQPPAA